MFKKKPEYVILHVRYAPDQKRLDIVRYVRSAGYFFWDWQLMDRARLIELLKQKKRVAVGWPNEVANTYRPGDPVQLVKVDDQEFIRTDKAAEPKDELNNLPIF